MHKYAGKLDPGVVMVRMILSVKCLKKQDSFTSVRVITSVTQNSSVPADENTHSYTLLCLITYNI